jgi:hypothetical protein
MVPLTGQVNRPFLGSIRAEVSRATSCIFVNLFNPSALKFSCDTPNVCCTSGDHTAIPAFDELLVDDFGLLVACASTPRAKTPHKTPQLAIKKPHRLQQKTIILQPSTILYANIRRENPKAAHFHQKKSPKK